jgi:single-stranded DNA-binding protein
LSEIRNNRVSLVGRLVGDPVQSASGRVYFSMGASKTQAPFRCFCADKTAENMMINLHDGDEVSVAGKLHWVSFNDSAPQLLVWARFTSYGRKARTLR